MHLLQGIDLCDYGTGEANLRSVGLPVKMKRSQVSWNSRAWTRAPLLSMDMTQKCAELNSSNYRIKHTQISEENVTYLSPIFRGFNHISNTLRTPRLVFDIVTGTET